MLYVFVSHCVFYVLFLSFVHFINAWWLSDPYWHILATSYYSLTESESNDNKSDGTSNNIDNNNSELWIQDLCSYFGALLLSFSFVFVSNFLMIFRANQMPSACTHTHTYIWHLKEMRKGEEWGVYRASYAYVYTARSWFVVCSSLNCRICRMWRQAHVGTLCTHLDDNHK